MTRSSSYPVQCHLQPAFVKIEEHILSTFQKAAANSGEDILKFTSRLSREELNGILQAAHLPETTVKNSDPLSTIQSKIN